MCFPELHMMLNISAALNTKNSTVTDVLYVTSKQKVHMEMRKQ